MCLTGIFTSNLKNLGKTLFIVQSNYIPWKGYFDCIKHADEFVVYDNVQYTKNDWRNRNLIKTESGLKWLTIPVKFKFSNKPSINEIRVDGQSWRHAHWEVLKQHYALAPHFQEVTDFLAPLYHGQPSDWLSEINTSFIRAINHFLEIDTPIYNVKDFEIVKGKTERLVDLCKKRDASKYLSGPSAKNYLDEDMFVEAGIELVYADYSNYLEYSQFHPPFVHSVSILDLLFHTGKRAVSHLNMFSTNTSFE